MDKQDVEQELDIIQDEYYAKLRKIANKTNKTLKGLLQKYLESNFEYKIGDIVLYGNYDWNSEVRLITNYKFGEWYGTWDSVSCSRRGLHRDNTSLASEQEFNGLGYESKRILTGSGGFSKKFREYNRFTKPENIIKVLGNLSEYPDKKDIARLVRPYHVKNKNL